jgi:Predicted small integral membrane protein (DUF2165)
MPPAHLCIVLSFNWAVAEITPTIDDLLGGTAADSQLQSPAWRAVNSPLAHTVFYIGIIAWGSVTMLLCWWAGVRLLKIVPCGRGAIRRCAERRRDCADDEPADVVGGISSMSGANGF